VGELEAPPSFFADRDLRFRLKLFLEHDLVGDGVGDFAGRGTSSAPKNSELLNSQLPSGTAFRSCGTLVDSEVSATRTGGPASTTLSCVSCSSSLICNSTCAWGSTTMTSSSSLAASSSSGPVTTCVSAVSIAEPVGAVLLLTIGAASLPPRVIFTMHFSIPIFSCPALGPGFAAYLL